MSLHETHNSKTIRYKLQVKLYKKRYYLSQLNQKIIVAVTVSQPLEITLTKATETDAGVKFHKKNSAKKFIRKNLVCKETHCKQIRDLNDLIKYIFNASQAWGQCRRKLTFQGLDFMS